MRTKDRCFKASHDLWLFLTRCLGLIKVSFLTDCAVYPTCIAIELQSHIIMNTVDLGIDKLFIWSIHHIHHEWFNLRFRPHDLVIIFIVFHLWLQITQYPSVTINWLNIVLSSWMVTSLSSLTIVCFQRQWFQRHYLLQLFLLFALLKLKFIIVLFQFATSGLYIILSAIGTIDALIVNFGWVWLFLILVLKSWRDLDDAVVMIYHSEEPIKPIYAQYETNHY